MEEAFLFEDDQLCMTEAGPWARMKHKKVGYYSALFSTSMKNSWDYRVYLDLFAGAGKARIKGTNDIIPGSPLLALNVSDPYDKYIFCEWDASNLSALRARAKRHFPGRSITFIDGDSNEKVDEILAALPPFKKTFRGLTLCFVDPSNMGQLRLETLERLASALYIDFLVLIPTYMDIHRNEATYTQAGNRALDLYLGSPKWREHWPDPKRPSLDFGIFVAEEFCMQMQKLGFLFEGLKDLELVKMSDDKNQPLYHLAFFSKSRLALRFWRDTRRNTKAQLSFLD